MEYVLSEGRWKVTRFDIVIYCNDLVSIVSHVRRQLKPWPAPVHCSHFWSGVKARISAAASVIQLELV